jgi:hypothetical protein
MLNTQHLSIEHILSTTPPERLVVRPQPGKWNIHDNIAHLTSYQPVFIDRIHQILIQENPYFGRYVADVDPAFENCRSLNIDLLINQLNSDRKYIYNLVTTLSEPELSRTGIHPKFGSLNIIGWAEFFLLHEAHHIFTIFQLAHNTELL